MKYRVKVTGEWFVEMDVETGTGEPFDNYESELKEAAIDNVRGRVINDDNCYTDVLWHARVMGPVWEGESQ